MKNIDSKEMAWKLFEHTGDINYYILYSELNGEKENWKK